MAEKRYVFVCTNVDCRVRGANEVFERFQATMEVFYAWRCLNCGEIMDQVVAKNREQERNPKRKAVGE